MVKTRVGRYLNEFRRPCVERMKQCDDISALSRELDIDRRLLYRWRDQLDRTHANPPCAKRVNQLKRVPAEKTLELD